MSVTRRLIAAAILACAGIVLAATPSAGQAPSAPTADMARLTELIVGRYTVVEKHHAGPNRPEWIAEGTASYRPGPDGRSLVEEYQSQGPRGPFSAVAVIWWDVEAGAFRHFECESGHACGVVEDSGAWDGRALVFTRHMERQGRKARLEQRYDFANPGSVVITASFSMDGGPMTTTMTITYTRVIESAAAGSVSGTTGR